MSEKTTVTNGEMAIETFYCAEERTDRRGQIGDSPMSVRECYSCGCSVHRMWEERDLAMRQTRYWHGAACMVVTDLERYRRGGHSVTPEDIERVVHIWHKYVCRLVDDRHWGSKGRLRDLYEKPLP